MNPIFKVSKVCGKMIFGIFILIFCEALSFRFIENYANFKVKLNWGDINSKALDAGRIYIPFGGLSSSPPTSVITAENTFQRILEEDGYSKSVLKFGRPARDKYFDYITEVQSPLANFDIRNFQDGMNLYVPSLNRFANKNDIECGYARRVGDKIEYSKAVFIEVLNEEVSEDFDLARQKTFGFLLGQGISCLTLKVQSQNELVQRIENLREQAPRQSQNIILWGEDQTASYIVEYLLKNQDVVSLAIIKDPAKLSDAVDSSIKPWILSIVSNAYLEEAPGGPNLLQRITGLGVGIRKASPATRQAGKQRGVRVATELNVKPPKVRQSARTGEPIEYAQGVLGDTRRRITDFVAGGLTTALAGTPVGQEILKRGWGGLKGMASGVMNPDGTKPKPEVKAEDDPFAALRKKK